MSLKLQIITLLASILYGGILYIMFLLTKKVLLSKNIFKRIITSLIFSFIFSTIYFVIIMYINNAILTFYSYLGTIIGIFTMKLIINKLKTYKN